MEAHMISLIHPSRSRPQKSFATTRKWLNNATQEIELIISLDDDDPQLQEYRTLYGSNMQNVICNPNKSSVEAVNNGAKYATGNILIVISDDTDCPNAWDQVISTAVNDREDFALKVYDGIQKYICTMPIIDRKYYERYGYIYHPDYLHLFCDTHFTHVADVTNKMIWRNDILFTHMHYSVRKSTKDHISEKADATINQGCETYLRHFKNNFGLHGIDCWQMNTLAEGHKEWLKNKLR